jgi:hypothetical protein
MADEIYKLAGDWGLRCLSDDPREPRWSIQFKGMDWIKVEDFLPPAENGRSTLSDDMRAFAAALSATPLTQDDKIERLRAENADLCRQIEAMRNTLG